MAIGVALLVTAVLIAGIYIIIEIKRLRHKLFAFFLIAMILFFYLSFTLVLKDQDLDLKTVTGLTSAGKIYMSWLGTIVKNTAGITMHAIKMDWGSNSSAGG